MTRIDRARLRRAAQKGALVLFGLLLAALLAEGIARLTGAGAPAEVDALFDRSPTFFAPQSQRYHKPRRKRDRHLVVVVGDSFTVGQNNQWDDTYPARLERLMNLNDEAEPAEVHVFARKGSSTADQTGLLIKGLRLRPNLVILGIFINDTEDYASGDLAALREPTLPRIPTGRTLAILQGSHALRWAYHKKEAYRSWRAVIDYYERLVDPEYSGWIRFREALADFSRRCDQRGAPLVAAVFPAMVALEESRYPFRLAHERIGWALDQESIPHIDLLDTFLGKSDLRMAAYPRIDGHPSEIGHRVAAEAIFEYLLDEGFLDASYRPALALETPPAKVLASVRRTRTPVALAD